ncbi:MAG: alanine racemase [Bacteroidales bacterium]|nr:alanine racemase [Bacteroidales bacterium]
MASTSNIEIINDALKNNVNFVNSIIENGTKISAVIKGNAYGHGTSVVVSALEGLGIDHFSVYSSPEAFEALKSRSNNSTIMIMGFINNEDYDWIISNKVEFYVSNIYALKKAIAVAGELNKKARIHIDVETGMNRTGLTFSELKKAVALIKDNKNLLDIVGVTSHFAGAESIANHMRIKKQFTTFKKRIKLLNDNGIYPKIRHIASSAAAINYPETKLDMIRTGILIFGYWPSEESLIYYMQKRKLKKNPLERAIRWKSQVVAIKDVAPGEFIGYGLSFQTQYKMKIMIVPVGYCNGYSRSLSNNGHVIVKEQNAPVIGSVNMNMIICDITYHQGINIGDEVILIGKQGNSEISFSSFAKMNNSLNYEILARLPENIERILIY